MARTLHDEEERLRRINLVGNYFVNNCGVSIRDASKYFKNMKIEMSNCTISNYLKLYKELHSEDRSIIDGKIKQNCPNTIMDEEVKKRVLYVAKVYVYKR